MVEANSSMTGSLINLNAMIFLKISLIWQGVQVGGNGLVLACVVSVSLSIAVSYVNSKRELNFSPFSPKCKTTINIIEQWVNSGAGGWICTSYLIRASKNEITEDDGVFKGLMLNIPFGIKTPFISDDDKN